MVGTVLVSFAISVALCGAVLFISKRDKRHLAKRLDRISQQRDEFVIKTNQKTGEVENLKSVLDQFVDKFAQQDRAISNLTITVQELTTEVGHLREENRELAGQVKRLSRSNERKDTLLRAVPGGAQA